ncbi:TetR/AcrR family transcriptional regulator [Flindersiella endophytica]
MRADARRNRDRLVAIAAGVIAEEGPDASLNEIARLAGVGPGTLYRHFPTRDELLIAVFRDRIETLCAKASEFAADNAPGEALAAWLHAMLAHALTDRGLAATMAIKESKSGFDCSAMLHSAASGLLTRAQQAAAIRPDLEVDDLFQLVIGIASATGDHRQAARLLGFTLDGLRQTDDRDRPATDAPLQASGP